MGTGIGGLLGASFGAVFGIVAGMGDEKVFRGSVLVLGGAGAVIGFGLAIGAEKLVEKVIGV